jgi:hypothetical protein
LGTRGAPPEPPKHRPEDPVAASVADVARLRRGASDPDGTIRRHAKSWLARGLTRALGPDAFTDRRRSARCTRPHRRGASVSLGRVRGGCGSQTQVPNRASHRRNFIDVSADIMEPVDPIFGDTKTAAARFLGG